MNNNFTYQSDYYDRQSQRFVIPLYIKDELDNYEYSSTGTLARYKEHHFIIFAAHALGGGIAFENVYTFGIDGDFHQIESFSIGHQVFEKEDIVIVDCFNQALENKNYFALDITGMNGFDKKHFAWTGFPSSKSKLKKFIKATPRKL